MVGWTIALQQQPAPTLPGFGNSTLEQELPFGPVKLVPRNGAKTAAPAKPTPAPAATAPKPLALPQSSAPPGAQAAGKKPSPAIRSGASQAARRRARQPKSDVADDEVIVHHYGATPSPKPTTAPKTVVSKDGPRRISDMN
jgi:hypothetical protein